MGSEASSDLHSVEVAEFVLGWAGPGHPGWNGQHCPAEGSLGFNDAVAVSYTQLTLPTILRV